MTGVVIRNIFTPFQLVDGVQLFAGTGGRDALTVLHDAFAREGVTMGVVFFGSFTTLPVKQQGPLRIVVGRKHGAFDFAIGRQKTPPNKVGTKPSITEEK